ncbi:MAG: hypothetical protein RL754_208 [Bacteroidota bacterium]|jgi:hypothetical protein
MKRNSILIAAVVLLTAVVFGLYSYFEKVEKASDVDPEVVCTTTEIKELLAANALAVGDVVRITGEIRLSESSSVGLDHGVIVSRDTTDAAAWPEEGKATFQGYYSGVEIDDFFGDTLYRVSAAFLLVPTESIHKE